MATIGVCPNEEVSVTPGAIRARRYRQGATHKANLARKRAERAARREDRLKKVTYHKSIGFDGRYQGPNRTDVPRIYGWHPATGVQTDEELDRSWEELARSWEENQMSLGRS